MKHPYLWEFRFLFFFLGLIFIFAPPAICDPYDDFVKKGRDHMGLFQYKEARSMFEKAISLDPGRFDGHFQLGLALRKLNEINSSMYSLEKAFKISHDDPDCAKALTAIYVHLAKEFKAAGNREGMLSYLGKGCAVYPQHTQNWASLLSELAADGKWKEIAAKGPLVKNSNREALEIGDDRNLQKSLIIIAKAFLELKDHSKAREYIKTAGMIHSANEDLIKIQNQLGNQATQVASSLFEEAKSLIDKGNYKDAIERLEKASGAESDNPEIANLLDSARKKAAIIDFTKAADEAETHGRYEEAQNKIERALERAEDDPILEKRLASLTEFIGKRNKKRAAEQKKIEDEARAKRLAEADRNTKLKDLLESAKRNEEKQSYGAAIKDYQDALEIDKDDADIVASIEKAKKLEEEANKREEEFNSTLGKAELAKKEGNRQEAYDLYVKLNGLANSRNQNVLEKLLETCSAMGKSDEIEKFCAQLENIASDSAPVNYYQGLLAYQKGDYSLANGAFEKVFEKDRLFSPDLRKMIWMTRLNKYRGPLISLLLVIGYFVSGSIFRYWQGISKSRTDARIERLIHSGDYASAIPLMEKRLGDFDYVANRRGMSISLGEGYLKTGQHDRAKAIGLEILAKEPKNVPAQRIMGEASFQMKETSPEGIERIQILLKIEETRKDVLAFLVSVYKSQQSDSKTALDTLHKQLTVAPEDEDTLFFLAEYYCKRATYNAQTQKVFERAIKVDSERPELLNALAQALLQTGKKEEASKLMQQGREKWPGHELFRSEPSHGGRSASHQLKSGSDSFKVVSANSEKPGSPEGNQAAAATGAGTRVKSTTSPVVRPKMASGQNASGDTIKCHSCDAPNSPREYYCTKCGKSLK